MRNNRREFCLGFGMTLFAMVLNNRGVLPIEGMMEPCKTTGNGACVVLCYNWDLGSRSGAEILKGILQDEGKKHKTCTLILDQCTLKNETINPWETLNPDDEPKIDKLKIIHSSIDINKLNLKMFQNVRQLTMKNTTATTLRPEAFIKLPHLRRLQLKDNKFLKRVRNGFLQNLTLDYLQIQGVDLNQIETFKFFQNLTAEREIPSVRVLDWSRNNFGNFLEKLLVPFSNLEVLFLNNCTGFGDEMFSKGGFTRVYISNNKIQGIFRLLTERGPWVSLKGYQLLCDCELEWIRSVVPEDEEIYPGNVSLRENSNESSQKLTITNNDPEYLDITISQAVDIERAFLWYANFKNMTSPHFKCLKILQRNFRLNITPDANYLICLVSKYFQIDISNCLPLKTKPHYEDQPWLTKKSIPLSIISIFVVFLFALATGALILYLSVRKNPSLIRGSKRVIEVKKHDKAQILIMPRGYQPVNEGEGSPLAITAPRLPLVPSRSFDTISTVSYVSANQPTQLEILTYRFNRLRELFQRNSVSSFFLPGQMITPISQRLPPNVDLLLEYEWYTITTTTTTTTEM